MNAKSLELQIKVSAEKAALAVTSLNEDFKDLAKSASNFSGDSKEVKKTIDTLSASAERTAKSLQMFGASSSELKSEQQKLKNGILDLVQHGMNPESAECKKLIDDYRKLGDESEKLEIKENGLFGIFDKLKGELGSVAVAAAAVKWDGMMIGAGANALELAGQFQTAREEFGTLIGDMQAGAALFDDVIKPFNDFTPFDLETTTQATKIFLAAKVPIADLTSTLNRMGNIAQGNSQKMISFANAFSKASAKGKADMEVLNVYLDQGVPILDELAKGFNTTTEEIIKMASKGEISFKDFELALERLNAEGGAYAEGLALASKSYASMWAGLHEALNSLAASIGDMFLPAACKILEWLTNVANAINNSPLVKGVLLGALTAITVWLNTKMIFALTSFIIKTIAGTAAQMGFNLALGALNPVILVATLAIAGLVAWKVKEAQATLEADKATRSQALAAKQAAQAQDEYALALNRSQIAAQNYIAAIQGMSNQDLEVKLKTVWSEEAIAQKEATLKSLDVRIAEAKKSYPQGAVYIEGERLKLQEDLDNTRAYRTQALQTLKQNTQNDAVAASGDLLKWRDEKYSQTTQGQIEELEAELAKAKSLYKAKVSEYDADGNFKNTDGYDAAKTAAIIKMLEERLANLKKQNEPQKQEEKPRPEFTTEWSKKLHTELEQIQDEEAESLQKLAENATAAFGDTWRENQECVEAYAKEEAALKQYYAEKVQEYERKLNDEREKAAEEEKQRILDRHELQMRTLQEEYTYIAEKAREAIDSGDYSAEDVGEYALGTFVQGAAGTEVFSMAAGSSPITELISAVSKVVFSIENVQKLLSPFSTILEGLMRYSELLINDALQPIVDILLDIGETIGQILQPVVGIIATALRVLAGVIKIVMVPLNMLGNAFEWLYNKVIRPVGNAIIKVMNAIISALNKLPFVNIKKLELLPIAGEKVGEVADAASKAADAARAKIEAMYKAQIDDINDELRYQIQSLQKQYELGLISRQQYIDQKNAYKAAADTEILKIEQQMAVALEHIEDNTYAALDQQQQAAVASQREDARQAGAGKSYAEQWGQVVPVLGHIAGGVADVAVGAWNGIKTAASGIASGFKSLFGFAVGTDNIPYDMPAIVHKGEGIIPKTFNEAIKSGTYSLVGRNSERRRENAEGRRGSTINVSVHVEGSVIKQKDLVAEIYNGLAAMIGSGEAAPLPA